MSSSSSSSSSSSLFTDTTSLSPMESAMRAAVKETVPKLSHSAHKGQSGKVAVVGGCLEYTGAPYFAAMSALRVGADLSHVFCSSEAASVIKSYSGELIVHPLNVTASEAFECTLDKWLPAMSSVVVGPGLGRSQQMLDVAAAVIERVVALDIPLVVDGDGLWLVAQRPELIRNYGKVVLTPNVVEFGRIADAVIGNDDHDDDDDRSAERVATLLGHVTILQKRAVDVITDGRHSIACTEVGSPRRCGGQGDITAGSIGTFLGWAYRRQDNAESKFSPTLIAAYAGVRLTKLCNEAAFAHKHRGATTTDMIEHIAEQFYRHYEAT